MFISKIEILESKEDEYNKNNLERDVELLQGVAMSNFFCSISLFDDYVVK